MSTVEIIRAIEAMSAFIAALGDGEGKTVSNARRIAREKILDLIQRL